MPDITKTEQQFDVIIIDGKNMTFKYFHGMSRLANSEGIPTGLFHGFLSMILKYRIENPTAEIIVVWEGGNLIRKKLVEGYKEGRPQTTRIMADQMEELKDMLKALNIDQKFSPGYEADDVAATIVHRKLKLMAFREGNKKILLITEDNDWLQMMKKNVFIRRKNKIVSCEKMQKELGFAPDRYVLHILLKGKISNKIKGVYDFPEKLAVEILGKCSTAKEAMEYEPLNKSDVKWIEKLGNDKELVKKGSLISLNKFTTLEDSVCRNDLNWKSLMKKLEKLELRMVKEMAESLPKKKNL